MGRGREIVHERWKTAGGGAGQQPAERGEGLPLGVVESGPGELGKGGKIRASLHSVTVAVWLSQVP